ARKALSHAFVRLFADRDRAALGGQFFRKNFVAGTHDRQNLVENSPEVTRRLDRDGDAVRQQVKQLVRAEAARRAGGEQDRPDLQVLLTSQAEGSKRGAGLAAQEGSPTPWRTAVISATIATAISGGVFEPRYRPTGPCRRAISLAASSNSSRRLRRASLFFLE